MMLYLGYESAVEYWRAVGSALVPMPRRSSIRCVHNEMTAGSQIIGASPKLRTARLHPVHVLVSKKSRSGAYPQVKTHVCAGMLPAGSFYRISGEVLVASPALCLLHAAQRTPPGKMLPLIELCCEFLGSYSLCDGAKRGFRNHEPFLSLPEVEAFIELLPHHTRGARLLAKALGLAYPLSASPRETECALMLSLPEEYGGYALPAPELNHRIEIPLSYRSMTDKEYLKLDLYWEDSCVALEYDGSDHNESNQIAEDKARRNLLATMGYRVIVLEKAHVSSSKSLGQQISQLAMLLGHELEPPSTGIAEKRERLRKHLFDPQHHQLCPYTRPLALLPADSDIETE